MATKAIKIIDFYHRFQLIELFFTVKSKRWKTIVAYWFVNWAVFIRLLCFIFHLSRKRKVPTKIFSLGVLIHWEKWEEKIPVEELLSPSLRSSVRRRFLFNFHFASLGHATIRSIHRQEISPPNRFRLIEEKNLLPLLIKKNFFTMNF